MVANQDQLGQVLQVARRLGEGAELLVGEVEPQRLCGLGLDRILQRSHGKRALEVSEAGERDELLFQSIPPLLGCLVAHVPSDNLAQVSLPLLLHRLDGLRHADRAAWAAGSARVVRLPEAGWAGWDRRRRKKEYTEFFSDL